MPFLGASIKLHLHSLAQDKVYLWWQTRFVQGGLGTMHSIQVNQLIRLILPLMVLFMESNFQGAADAPQTIQVGLYSWISINIAYSSG